ncbi:MULTISPECIES: A24 family peptidase [unclassified Paenibacillus]|uniref:A24 family peptidase n=1 Tax=unclassified Paenibacillus TaxID=185978 RepID=UPI000954AF96|nr:MULTISPECIES: A24 family peptidase [unclassified Paenibacillus]ASS68860.2 prepilin peptidase [Paenibacillus sp. RUD330]SIR17653.1 Type IV leader peptidase family protein [Paenibacillus sp. RU4X]SIR21205.1 Type IV leader peptidase family protein [Paenibacillus sp. RU4T]
MEAWNLWGCFLLVSIAFGTDIRSMRIPNWLPLTFAPAGLLLHLLDSGLEGLLHAAAGMAAGFLPLLALYACGGIGAGDVKLFGAAGAWLGWLAVTELMLYSFLYGGIGGAAFLIARRISRIRKAAPGTQALSGEAAILPWTAGQSPNPRSGQSPADVNDSGDIPSPGHAAAEPAGGGEATSPVRFPFMLAVFPGMVTLWLS